MKLLSVKEWAKHIKDRFGAYAYYWAVRDERCPCEACKLSCWNCKFVTKQSSCEYSIPFQILKDSEVLEIKKIIREGMLWE